MKPVLDRRFEWILPAAAALCLLGHTLILSPHKPMWLDEVYTYYAVAHGSFGAFARSFSTNMNATPPPYFALLWALSKAIPLSVLSLRLYSSLGCAAAFWLIWATLRRHTGFFVSSVAALAALLTSELFLIHDVEARFYGAYMATAAWAVYNCDRLWADEKPPRRRLVWNTVSHALLISTTYVGGLYSAAILVALLIRDRTVRVWRPAVYLSIFAGWAPVILYAPAAAAQKRLDSWLAKPALSAALDPVDFGMHPYVLFAVFAALATIAFLRRGGDRNSGEGRRAIFLGVILMAVPYVMLGLAWAGAPLLLDRYALPSLIGEALLFAGICVRLFGDFDDGAARGLERLLRVATIAGLLACPFWRAVSATRDAIAEDSTSQYRADGSGPTIATSDPHSYFPRYYYSGESKNIYYVVRNQESQERYTTFNPRLNPIAVSTFLADHDSFRIISDDPDREWLEAELRKRGGFAIETEERTEKRKVLTVTRK